jgi:hypothetical protein
LNRRLAQPSLAAGSQRRFVTRAAVSIALRVSGNGEKVTHTFMCFNQRDWMVHFHGTRCVSLTSAANEVR